MVFPCDDGYRPYRKASLEAVALGAMPWGEVITHRISYEEMPAFYSDIYSGKGGASSAPSSTGKPHAELAAATLTMKRQLLATWAGGASERSGRTVAVGPG